MATFATIRVAAVQAAPVILDLDASVEKAIGLMREAKATGAQLVALPECFLSLYPSWQWGGEVSDGKREAGELWLRLWESSVDVPGPQVDRLVAACAELDVHCVIGVNERESSRPGASLYNTMLTLGPSGVLLRHRKLMPTLQERMFHAFGDGRDLGVVETLIGRIGGLTCWENRMPLARYAVYRGSPQIWVAPTADDSEPWIALMQAIAVESGAFVLGVCQYTPRSAYPADFPLALPGDEDPLSTGGTVIVDARGHVLAGPLRGREGMLVADCDLRQGAIAKQAFDVTGHYACEPLLLPLLRDRPALRSTIDQNDPHVQRFEETRP